MPGCSVARAYSRMPQNPSAQTRPSSRTASYSRRDSPGSAKEMKYDAIAARSARIGDGHLNFGQMGGGGSLTLLPRAIGRERAAELIFTGRLLAADEAASWGLVNRVVDDDVLESVGLELARDIATKSPLGLANGTLNPVVGREFPLADAGKAHEAVLEAGAYGKIVITTSKLEVRS